MNLKRTIRDHMSRYPKLQYDLTVSKYPRPKDVQGLISTFPISYRYCEMFLRAFWTNWRKYIVSPVHAVTIMCSEVMKDRVLGMNLQYRWQSYMAHVFQEVRGDEAMLLILISLGCQESFLNNLFSMTMGSSVPLRQQ